MAAHLSQRAADFDARGAAAHHHYIQQRLPLSGIIGEQRFLEILEDEAPQIQRVRDTFYLHRIALDALQAEEIGE